MAPPGASTDDDLLGGLPKIFLVSLVANLPMLTLLLTPQLVRSRAGSETLLFVGSSLYLVLVVIALTTAPRVSAFAAPMTERWTTRTAGRTARELRRTRPRDLWRRVGEWFLLFLLGQAAGFLVAWLMPYVSDNPAFGAPGEARWIIHYRNYAVQAVAIYVLSCLSFAWFGARLRQLAVARPPPTGGTLPLSSP
jgi:hypothetical protein